MAETVTIGCKLPHGIVASLNDVEVHINGANASDIIGGYGQTVIDKAFFDQWASIHKDAAFFTKELIFQVKDSRSFKDAANERRDVKNGVEGIDPEAPAPGLAEEKDAKKRKSAE